MEVQTMNELLMFGSALCVALGVFYCVGRFG
jgi:hypothetical protein